MNLCGCKEERLLCRIRDLGLEGVVRNNLKGVEIE